MGTSHFSGPLEVSQNQRASGGGMFEDAPIDALKGRSPSLYYKDFLDVNDFVSGTNWTVTNITSGTAAIGAETNGNIRLAATTDNQGLGSVQHGAAASTARTLVPAASTICIFEARVAHSNWSEGDWFIGVGEYDTTFMGADGALTANGGDNHAGFHHQVADDTSFNLSVAGTALANTQNPTGLGTAAGALTDDQYYRFGFRINGVGLIRFYIDDVPVSEWTSLTADFAEPLTPTFCMIAEGAALTMDVDYVLASQTRV